MESDEVILSQVESDGVGWSQSEFDGVWWSNLESGVESGGDGLSAPDQCSSVLLFVSRVLWSDVGVAGLLPEQTLIRARACSSRVGCSKSAEFSITANCNEAPDRLAAHRAACINAESGGIEADQCVFICYYYYYYLLFFIFILVRLYNKVPLVMH